MVFISSVAPGSGEQPGEFGWLMIKSLEGDSDRTSTDLLTLSRSALTVGVYDDTAKSEIQEIRAGCSL